MAKRLTPESGDGVTDGAQKDPDSQFSVEGMSLDEREEISSHLMDSDEENNMNNLVGEPPKSLNEEDEDDAPK